MFPGGAKSQLEVGVLRSGRRFQLGKRRKIERGRWNPNFFKGSKHEHRSCEDEGYCDEEEDYIPISEGPENSDS